jgi:hypothetical protein
VETFVAGLLEKNRVNKLSIILALLLTLGTARLFSQELPRPSMARHEAVSALPSDYNAKIGPVLLNTNASLEGEYVNNIGLSSSNQQSDFIISPQVGVTASWPVTATNTLRFSTSVGYNKYMIHPQYDTGSVMVAPDSELSFDVYVGDFKINFHDQFSVQQDPASIGSLNNVVNFNRIQNVAGIGVLWDLNKLILGFNYDHISFISTNLQALGGTNLSNPGNIDYSADQISAVASYRITSTVVAGAEFAGSLRYYDQFGIEDNQLSAGPFARIEVTPTFKVSMGAGYQEISTGSGSLTNTIVTQPNNVAPVLGVGTYNSWYGNLTFDHRLNSVYTDRLSFGHELELNVFSQINDTYYVSYTSSWKVNSFLNLAFTLNYENVTSPSQTTTLTNSSFDAFNAGVQANFPITKSISGAVLYQFSDNFGTSSSPGYTQDRVGMILNYHF